MGAEDRPLRQFPDHELLLTHCDRRGAVPEVADSTRVAWARFCRASMARTGLRELPDNQAGSTFSTSISSALPAAQVPTLGCTTSRRPRWRTRCVTHAEATTSSSQVTDTIRAARHTSCTDGAMLFATCHHGSGERPVAESRSPSGPATGATNQRDRSNDAGPRSCHLKNCCTGRNSCRRPPVFCRCRTGSGRGQLRRHHDAQGAQRHHATGRLRREDLVPAGLRATRRSAWGPRSSTTADRAK